MLPPDQRHDEREDRYEDQGADAGQPRTRRPWTIAQAGQPRYPCLYPWERILLNPRGELAFCPQDWVHGSVIARYRDTTIREVWSGEEYRALREAHLTGNFCDHKFCGQCPDWQQTRWPGEGRSYADMIEEFAASAAA